MIPKSRMHIEDFQSYDQFSKISSLDFSFHIETELHIRFRYTMAQKTGQEKLCNIPNEKLPAQGHY